MATRFYLPSTGIPSISPAFGAGWGVTTNADRRNLVTTRISSAMTNKDGVADAATGQQLLRQYISAPLAAQTISGTFKGQIRAQAGGGSGTVGPLAVRIAKCASDGSGVTELCAISFSSDTGTGSPPNPTTTMTNRRLETGSNDFVLDVASTAVSSGDCLIIELGYDDTTTNVSRYGIQSYGDDSATDLAEDESTTAADNPWVEFTHDFTFAGAGGTTAPRMLLLGVG